MPTPELENVHAGFQRLLSQLMYSDAGGVIEMSSLSSVPELERAGALCEAIIKTASTTLTDLRRKRNSLVPISQLPTELLIDTWKQILDPGIQYYTQLRGLRLVSARWRDAIDEAANLWTISCCSDKPRELEIAMSKSRGLPLEVYVHCREALGSGYETHDHTEFSKFLQYADTRVVPWRTLDIQPFDMDMSSIEVTLNTPAPNMEVLKVATERRFHIEGDLFAGTAPRLQHVHLSACSVAWDSAALTHLKTLHITRIFEHRPSLEEFIHILAASPRIEVVYVDQTSLGQYFAIPGPEEPSQAHCTITLPFLRSLTLVKHRSQTLTYILTRITAPSLETLSVTADVIDITDSQAFVATIVPWLRQHMERHPSTSLSLGISDFWLQFQYGSDYPFKIGFSGGLNASEMSEVAAHLLKAIPAAAVSQITSLTFEAYYSHPFTAIHPFLNSITNLTLKNQELIPDNPEHGAECNTTFLSRPLGPEEDGSGVPQTWMFPRMRTLRVGWADTTPGVDLVGLVENRLGLGEDVEGFEGPYPDKLETLVLERGPVSSDVVERIRALGVIVNVHSDVTFV